MTLTKTILTALAISAFTSLSAQNIKKEYLTNSYGYVRLGVGYNIPVAGQRSGYGIMPYNGTMQLGDNGPLTFDLKNASFSAGTYGNLAIGAIFSKNIGFEVNTLLNINATKYTGNLEYTEAGYLVKERYTNKKVNNIFINPAIVLETGKKVKAFMRTGIIIPVLSRMENDFYHEENANQVQMTISGSEKVKHRFNIGVSGAAGLKLHVGSGVMVLLEANYTSLTLDVKSTELISYYYNRQNVLKYISNTGKSYGANSRNGTGVSPTSAHPYSSAGLNLGVEFTF